MEEPFRKFVEMGKNKEMREIKNRSFFARIKNLFKNEKSETESNSEDDASLFERYENGKAYYDKKLGVNIIGNSFTNIGIGLLKDGERLDSENQEVNENFKKGYLSENGFDANAGPQEINFEEMETIEDALNNSYNNIKSDKNTLLLTHSPNSELGFLNQKINIGSEAMTKFIETNAVRDDKAGIIGNLGGHLHEGSWIKNEESGEEDREYFEYINGVPTAITGNKRDSDKMHILEVLLSTGENPKIVKITRKEITQNLL